MADLLTPNISLIKPPVGASRNTWGQKLNDNSDRLDALFAVLATLLPPGLIADFGSAAAPPGWLWCDGRAVLRATYPVLYNAVGTTWGAGDGSTTFNLPDFRGRVRATQDNLGGTAALRLTAAVSGVVADALGGAGGDQRAQKHAHALTDPGHGHTGSSDVQGDHAHTYNLTHGPANFGNAGGAGGLAFWDAPNQPTGVAGAHGHTITVAGAATGITIAEAGEGTTQNVQPTIMVTTAIFTGLVFPPAVLRLPE